MKSYTYVIIGGGMAADSAIRGIREVDGHGSIALIGAEDYPPYDRPPLTKGLWTGKKKLEKLWRQTAGRGADLYLNQRVVAFDPLKKIVKDDKGVEYEYHKLLIATGGRPRELPFGKGLIRYFRTIEDYQALRAEADEGGRFVVIGGSFIGSELAAALAMHKQQVTMIFPGKGICANIFPPGLVQHLNDFYKEKGVEILSGDEVVGVEGEGKNLKVRTKKGKAVEANYVVAGIGIQPNVELAQAAGLHAEDGIVVGEDLETSHADVFAAGDVAAFSNIYLGGRLRVEHEDNTNAMGRVAGHNMAGRPTPYDHIPMFYSDLFELGYEAAGRLDSRFNLVEEWKEEPYKKGIVYYLDDGHLRGVLLWNVWEKVDAARKLIQSVGPKRAEDVKGRI